MAIGFGRSPTCLLRHGGPIAPVLLSRARNSCPYRLLVSLARFRQLNNALVEHGVGDLYKTGYIGADHEISGLPVLFRSVPGVFKDCGHDVAQARIDLLARPW